MSNTSTIQVTVIEIIKRYIDEDSSVIYPETKLISELGIDSLDLLDIIFDLEHELKVAIPIDEWTANEEISADDFVEMLTLQRIVDYVAEKQQT